MAQSKSSPIMGLLIDLAKGETYIGEPMFEGGEDTLFRELQNRMTPLFIQDLLEALEADGYTGMIPASTGFWGIGVTAFEKEKSEYISPRDIISGETEKAKEGESKYVSPREMIK